MKKVQNFGFLDPDPLKYVHPRIRIQGAKYLPKTEIFFILKPEELLNKERV